MLFLSALGSRLDFELFHRQIEIRINIQSLSMQSPFRVYDWGPYIYWENFCAIQLQILCSDEPVKIDVFCINFAIGLQ